MKQLMISLIQLDADIKSKNIEGVERFLDEFDPLYSKLFQQYRFSESEFKNDVRQVYEYLFSDQRILDFLKDERGLISCSSITNSLFQKFYQIRDKHTPYDYCPIQKFGNGNPLASFVTKYQGRYDKREERLSVWQKAIIAVYENRVINNDRSKLYIQYSHYSKSENRVRVGDECSSQRKALNHYRGRKEIILYLKGRDRQKAEDELCTLRNNIISEYECQE